MRVTAMLNIWRMYVFTIRAYTSKQRHLLAASLWVTSIPPARFWFQHSGIIPPIDVTTSLCFFKLLETQVCFFNRKKLSELDNIQRYFNQKLSPPTFPSWGEQDVSASKPEIQRETDACQLLSKSKQLVGEVNSIITGELFLTISIAIVIFDRLAIYSLELCRSCLSHCLWLKDLTVL